jgi:hypothetical protein
VVVAAAASRWRHQIQWPEGATQKRSVQQHQSQTMERVRAIQTNCFQVAQRMAVQTSRTAESRTQTILLRWKMMMMMQEFDQTNSAQVLLVRNQTWEWGRPL